MTVKEFAVKYGVSARRVQKLIKEGRIPAVKMYGGSYFIDSNASYPLDKRRLPLFALSYERKPK